MALKSVHVADIPHLDQVPENASLPLSSSSCFSRPDAIRTAFLPSNFLVIGHRGNGMNSFNSPDLRMRHVKENTILSFNAAAELGVHYVEFDVQVTRDEYPVIFHDNHIVSLESGTVSEKRVTDLNLSDFRSYGLERERGALNQNGKTLMRKTKGGKMAKWEVDRDDEFCTLEEAFERVSPAVGFNIELKFDDQITYRHDDLVRVLRSILKVVSERAGERPIIFSTFQPDAALLVRRLQTDYPVFFLTDGGTKVFGDARRNSLEEAVKLCLQGGLQGIVSEVRAVFGNPPAVSKIKDAGLFLLTYGQLNNVCEAVYLQRLMGVHGVIVDFVGEIFAVVSAVEREAASPAKDGLDSVGTPRFSPRELSFLLKLIPQLMHTHNK